MADDFRSEQPEADLTAQQRKQLQQAPELLYECHLSRVDRGNETSELETAPSLCAGPEEQVVQAEDQQQARALLNRAMKKYLTSREADVIRLRYYDKSRFTVVERKLVEFRKIGKDGAEMMLIPAGSFSMGPNDGSSDEKPVHRVELDGFYMDKSEVTVGQFKQFVQQCGYSYEGDWSSV